MRDRTFANAWISAQHARGAALSMRAAIITPFHLIVLGQLQNE
jgi:hypothetical protein